MEQTARLLAQATMERRRIFIFGCSHAGLLSSELCYRTGGMATINAVRAPGMQLDIHPLTMTSEMERLPQYGTVSADNIPLQAGDVLLLHSVSGRNPVIVDVALRAKERGATVVALTNVAYSQSVSSRHPKGLKLMDVADILLDNTGVSGDASIDVPGVPEKVAPTSTVVGAAMLNAIVAQAIAYIAQAGKTPPVFLSSNLDEGDAHNARMLVEYRDLIFYL